MERQKHGLNYENIVFNKFPNIRRNPIYTGKWDGFLGKDNIPVSIKTRKLGSNDVEMGDFFRQSQVNEDFILFLSFWEYDINKEKKIVEEYIFVVPRIFYINNFPLSYVEEQKNVFDNVDVNEERNRQKDLEWIQRRNEYKKRRQSSGSKVKIRYKKDHKGQKRIQCAFPIHELFYFEQVDEEYIRNIE